jgi:hypothetical protein
MIADIFYEGKEYRFRVALISNINRAGTIDSHKLDYELTCISDEYPEKLAVKRFDHYTFKKYWREGIIKLEI